MNYIPSITTAINAFDLTVFELHAMFNGFSVCDTEGTITVTECIGSHLCDSCVQDMALKLMEKPNNTMGIFSVKSTGSVVSKELRYTVALLIALCEGVPVCLYKDILDTEGNVIIKCNPAFGTAVKQQEELPARMKSL